MTEARQLPAAATVAYARLGSFSPEEGERFTRFIEWFDDLERFIQGCGSEMHGCIGISSPTLAAFLYSEGLNNLIQVMPEAILDRLKWMPDIPTKWPHTHRAEPILEKLSRLSRLQPLGFPVSEFAQLKADALQQAKRLEWFAGELATG